MRIAELAATRVAIWGAGREGRAAYAALRRRLPATPLVWILSEAERDALTEAQADPLLRFFTEDPARPRADGSVPFADFDVVVKSPGISPYGPAARAALAAGVRFTSGTALWSAEGGHARVIAVTATKGKSTTAALIAHLLRAAGWRTGLAGNIGLPVIELLDVPEPQAHVLELSSFQTGELCEAPDIAVVLNVFEEHLDWHGNAARYVADKLALLGRPGARPRVSVLDAERALPPGFEPETGVRRFNDPAGFHVREDAIRRGERVLLPLAELPLPGLHNAQNACAALTAVAACGLDASALAPALRTFKPLPHRLQPLGLRDGLEFVNDSIATTPNAALAALAHYRARGVTLIAGGYDRGLDWSGFAQALRESPPRALIALGQCAPRILDALGALPPEAPRRAAAASLEAALARAREWTPPGGVVLLSPGAPSFGEFRDYIDRGRAFARLAGFDPERIASIEGLGIA